MGETMCLMVSSRTFGLRQLIPKMPACFTCCKLHLQKQFFLIHCLCKYSEKFKISTYNNQSPTDSINTNFTSPLDPKDQQYLCSYLSKQGNFFFGRVRVGDKLCHFNYININFLYWPNQILWLQHSCKWNFICSSGPLVALSSEAAQRMVIKSTQPWLNIFDIFPSPEWTVSVQRE